MKILLVSMPSIHVIRWVENLKDTDYKLYWFNVLERGKLETFDSIRQFSEWRKRKLPYIKGEYFLSKKYPDFYERILPYLEVTANEALEKIILEIEPDIIHSFEMQGCSYPILKTMNKYINIKWIYSCWGSDLFYYKNFKNHNIKIRNVLKRVNFLHTDCERDFEIAKQLGFVNTYLGVIPGGTGFKLEDLQSLKEPVLERKIILVKGYQHTFGRSLNVIKAIESIGLANLNYQVVIFGAHNSVINYVRDKNLDIKIYSRNELRHEDVLKLMGKSLLYIGNNISDGLPNSLLEAIVMGAFPIQSNPGGATAEIIDDGKNGLLIDDPNDIESIRLLILKALNDKSRINTSYIINSAIANERLDYKLNKDKAITIYRTAMDY